MTKKSAAERIEESISLNSARTAALLAEYGLSLDELDIMGEVEIMN